MCVLMERTSKVEVFPCPYCNGLYCITWILGDSLRGAALPSSGRLLEHVAHRGSDY